MASPGPLCSKSSPKSYSVCLPSFHLASSTSPQFPKPLLLEGEKTSLFLQTAFNVKGYKSLQKYSSVAHELGNLARATQRRHQRREEKIGQGPTCHILKQYEPRWAQRASWKRWGFQWTMVNQQGHLRGECKSCLELSKAPFVTKELECSNVPMSAFCRVRPHCAWTSWGHTSHYMGPDQTAHS